MGRISLLVVVVLALGGCTRPPPGGGGKSKPIPKGSVGPVDLTAFVQDRPAIAGKWYDYDNSTHVETPKPQAWIVRDDDPAAPGTDRYAAFRIVSIYDATDSGLFTLARAAWDGNAWSTEAEWVSPHNEKVGDVCVDLFAGDDVACTSDSWQVRLTYFKFFAVQSLFIVNNPGVFVRAVAGTDLYGAVRIARVDDITDLANLPNPEGVEALNETADASAWDSTEWSFDQYAPDLPLKGMAVGTRFENAPNDVWFMLTQRLDLVRMQFAYDGSENSMHVSFASVAMDSENLSVPKAYPADATVDVLVPQVDGATYLKLDTEGLVVTEDTVWPHERPAGKDWDLALERADTSVRILVSPGAGVVNATQRGLDEDTPPLDPESP